MFKTMNGVDVYDREDIDATLGTPEAGATGTAFKRIAATERNVTLLNNKVTRKADKNELAPLVQEECDNIISAKVNEIAGTFETAIDTKVAAAVEAENINGKIATELTAYDTASQVTTKIETALTGYDDSNAVDTKISTAIGNIPAGPSAVTTSEATALVNTYF